MVTMNIWYLLVLITSHCFYDITYFCCLFVGKDVPTRTAIKPRHKKFKTRGSSQGLKWSALSAAYHKITRQPTSRPPWHPAHCSHAVSSRRRFESVYSTVLWYCDRYLRRTGGVIVGGSVCEYTRSSPPLDVPRGERGTQKKKKKTIS